MRSLQHLVRAGDARYKGDIRRRESITHIVWHCTAGDRASEAYSWLNRPASDHPASYHYLISNDRVETCEIIRMAPIDRITYHAGRSGWPNPPAWPAPWHELHVPSLNPVSIGISWANDNGTDRDLSDDPLTPWQIEAGLWLGVTMMHLCPNVTIGYNRGHCEVSPGRKTDPLTRVVNMDWWRELLREAMAQDIRAPFPPPGGIRTP